MTATAGDYIYVTYQAAGFQTFFGFAAVYVSSAASISGDDAIELFMSGIVVDIFGGIDVDGSGEPWEYLDGWTYRTDSTGADGTNFVLSNYTFSGANALDDESSNATATTPFPTGTYSATVSVPTVLINEVDSDSVGTDILEFVELFDGGAGSTALDGLVLVCFNGNGDTSYRAIDLDGFSTDASGYLVAGNSAVANVSFVFPSNGLQNGPDAVALFSGNASDFPNGTTVTTPGIIDAIVYDTNDRDDAELAVLVNARQPQVNEGGSGDKDNHSNQRCANGTGGERNTDTYEQFLATPGAENICMAPAPATELFIHEIQGSGNTTICLGACAGTHAPRIVGGGIPCRIGRCCATIPATTPASADSNTW